MREPNFYNHYNNMKKEIQPHQSRVVSEFLSLDKKFKDIQEFICDNPLFGKLPGEEAHLLKQQRAAMFGYREILESRLRLWDLQPESEESSKFRTQTLALAANTVTDCGGGLGCTCRGVAEAAFARHHWAERHSKDSIIRRAKDLRVAIDSVLQDVRAFGKECLAPKAGLSGPHATGFEFFADPQEVPANVKLSQRALEDATMRLGMVLKAIGATNPYPESYNPESNRIEPTADTAPSK